MAVARFGATFVRYFLTDSRAMAAKPEHVVAVVDVSHPMARAPVDQAVPLECAVTVLKMIYNNKVRSPTIRHAKLSLSDTRIQILHEKKDEIALVLFGTQGWSYPCFDHLVILMLFFLQKPRTTTQRMATSTSVSLCPYTSRH